MALAVAAMLTVLAGPASADSCTAGTCTATFGPGTATWTVPAGLTSAMFTVDGAQGGSSSSGVAAGGLGGEVSATLRDLTANEQMTVTVGRAGGVNAGGSNGGGGVANGAGGGGGFSSVADGSGTLLLVAGGGGGGGTGGSSPSGEPVPGGAGGAGGLQGTNGGDGAVLGGSVDYDLEAGGGASGGNGGSGGGGAGLSTGIADAGAPACTGPILPLTGGGGAANGHEGGADVPGDDPVGGDGGGGGGGGWVGGGAGGGTATVTCPDGTSVFSGGGGGGGSSLGPAGATFTTGAHSGDGMVTITYATATAVNPGAQSNVAGRPVSVPIDATGPSGGTLSYSAAGLPDGLSIDSNTGVISGTPTTAQSSSVTVTVTTTAGASSSVSFQWTITIPVTNPGAQNSVDWVAVSLPIQASTPSGQTLTYSAAGLPDGLSIDPNTGVISGTPTTTQSSSVTVTVTTTAGASSSVSFQWTITTPVTNPGAQSNVAGRPVSVPIDATGPSGQTLTYSAAGLPDGLSIDPNTGVISGTPTTVQSSSVTVTVTTTAGASSSVSFQWTITIPVTNPGAQNSVDSAAVSFPIHASDPSGGTLSYSAAGLPDGLSIDERTGVISGEPTSPNGRYSVTVTVTDAAGASGSVSFEWTITIPVMIGAGAQTSTAGAQLSLPIRLLHPPNDQTITYVATGLPDGLSIDSGTGVISGTPTTAGSSSVTVTAQGLNTNGTPSKVASVSFTWTVIAAPPVATDTISNDEALLPGSSLSSNNGTFVLKMQSDGNLVLYTDAGVPLWASNTNGTSTGNYAVMQSDGNLVVYSSTHQPLWASNTSGNPGAKLVMQDDGNLVIYSATGTPLWASNTAGQ